MRKILVIVVLGLILLLLGMAGLSALQSHRQQSAIRAVSDTFVADVLAGKSNDSHALLANDTQGSTSTDAWIAQVQKLSSFFKGSSAQYQSLTKSSSIQLVTYSITGSDGVYKLSVILVQQAKVWRVQSFTSELK